MVPIFIFFNIFCLGIGEASAQITISEITLSKSIPAKGDKIKIKAKIYNKEDKKVNDVLVKFFNGEPAKSGTQIGKDALIKEISPKSIGEAEIEWVPLKNGIYRIFVVIEPGKETKEIEVPVVEEQLHIFYWHCPESTRYVTSRRSDDEKERNYWKERGVIPTVSVSGYFRRNSTEEEFADYWSSAEKDGYPGIDINEFGDIGVVGERMAAALIRTRKRCPNLFIVVWAAGFGGPSSIESYKKASVDLLIAEIYCSSFMNYRNFDNHWDAAKKYGLTDIMLFGLGLYASNASHGESWITTEQELLSQLRYIRKLAPEMKGVAFFSNVPDYLYEAADKAVYEYYIKPVIWIKEISQGKAIVSNIGGMDAKDVLIEFYWNSKKTGGKISSIKLKFLKAGEEKAVSFPTGANYLLIAPAEDYTVLE